MTDPDVHGPIDFLIIEFPADGRGDGTAQALVDLLDQGTIRLFDLVAVSKAADGSCVEIDLTAGDARLAAFSQFAGGRSGLLGAQDVQEAANALDPDTVAIVVLYENTWAIPFVAAARDEDAQMVATARLTAQEIMDALDAVESAD